MYQFEFGKPTNLEDAKGMLAQEGSQALSGGQTLIPTLKQRLAAPEKLIDLKSIEELRGISAEGTHLCIGATMRHVEVETSDVVLNAIPALADLAAHIGDAQVRRRGTLGGSVANNDPAACYPSAVLALDAQVHTSKRVIPADEFFAGLFMTALEEGEIITRIDFKIPEKAKYMKFPHPASRYAMTGVFVAKHADHVRVAYTGANENGVTRHAGLEEALMADFSPAGVANVEVSSDGLMSDIHASATYRANLIKVMTKRAVEALV